jgi:hypothetical protein
VEITGLGYLKYADVTYQELKRIPKAHPPENAK